MAGKLLWSRILLPLFCAPLLALVVSCPFGFDSSQNKGGSITIHLSPSLIAENYSSPASAARAAVPSGPVLEQLSYTWVLTGPGPRQSGAANAEGGIALTGLVPGSWHIDITAFLDGGEFGYGDLDFTIRAGQSTRETIRMWTPLSPLLGGAGILYVKTSRTGTGDGSSWENATDDFSVIETNPSIQQVWMAAGTYKPLHIAGTGATDRDKAFILVDGVKIYGGFPANATDWTQGGIAARNIKVHKTILSGDIGTPGDDTDNVYHVVLGANLTASTVLDGVTIQGGNANGSGSIIAIGETFNRNSGGGIYNGDYSSPVLTNVTIAGNAASSSGGAIYNYNSSNPQLTNVTIAGNAAAYGGGISNDNSNPVLTNVTIAGNTASNSGGAIDNYNSSNPQLINVTIAGNDASTGGAIYNDTSTPVIQNSIIWANTASTGANIFNFTSTPDFSYSLVEGSTGNWIDFGTDSGNNIDSDPLFTDPAAAASAPTTEGDYRLKPGSPAIDAGDSTLNSLTTDLDGSPRVRGGDIDLGAYEF